MKKILFGIFAIVLCMPNAYCDNEQTLINTNVSYQDILDHEIRADAIRYVISIYLPQSDGTIWSRVLRKAKRNGKITVGSFYDACKKPRNTLYAICMEMIERVIVEHNRLVMESANDGLLTEEQFNKLYRNAGVCPTRRVSYRGEPDLCKSQCIQYAISNLCQLVTYEYFYDRKYEGCFCNTGYEDGVVNFEYTPTYEDYTKAKRGE